MAILKNKYKLVPLVIIILSLIVPPVMENTRAAILEKNIADLGLSKTVAHFFDANDIHNLRELLKMPMADWFTFTGFSQHLLNELMNYFERTDLLILVVD